ncbi:MAG TPA: YHS domain-containing protein [Candidatus Tripitaka californicus]
MFRRACLLTLVAFLALGWSSLAIAQEGRNMYDPVCGMKAGKDTPHVTEYSGKKYSFCSDKCKAEFLKEPVKYA